jgi:hypothetical protein
MSILPDAAGPKGAPFGAPRGTAEPELQGHQRDGVTIRSVDIVRLQPGDRLIVHADGDLGLGGGGAHKIAQQLNDLLRLDELGFDVPVCVTAPGLRVEVLRPS